MLIYLLLDGRFVVALLFSELLLSVLLYLLQLLPRDIFQFLFLFGTLCLHAFLFFLMLVYFLLDDRFVVALLFSELLLSILLYLLQLLPRVVFQCIFFL